MFDLSVGTVSRYRRPCLTYIKLVPLAVGAPETLSGREHYALHCTEVPMWVWSFPCRVAIFIPTHATVHTYNDEPTQPHLLRSGGCQVLFALVLYARNSTYACYVNSLSPQNFIMFSIWKRHIPLRAAAASSTPRRPRPVPQ